MGKTVTTYLINGDPKGTQYVFISNKICKMYVIPRSNLSILNERQELQTPHSISCWVRMRQQSQRLTLARQRISVNG